ncbi:MAG: hypothetical protein E8D52_00305 [Nitrospira sp.]|nr:MAG: hypothetical protein E8D52_00305 [Nitrospira sp.]
MVEATSESVWCQTQLTSGAHSSLLDTTREKGGSESGFHPHGLLEAVQTGMTTRVMQDCSRRGAVAFEYEVELQGERSEQNRDRLLDVAGKCPVRRTLFITPDIPPPLRGLIECEVCGIWAAHTY